MSVLINTGSGDTSNLVGQGKPEDVVNAERQRKVNAIENIVLTRANRYVRSNMFTSWYHNIRLNAAKRRYNKIKGGL